MKRSNSIFQRGGSFVAIGLVLSYLSFHTDIGRQLEEWTRDLRLRHRESSMPSDKVRIVGVTDKDLDVLGGWPISRGAHADIVRILNSAGAVTTVLDVLFTEVSPDPGADEALKTTLESVPGTVLAYSFDEVAAEDPGRTGERRHFQEGHLYGSDLAASPFPLGIDPVPPFAPIKVAVGAANAPASLHDGIIRDVPLFFQHGGKLYPGLAMQGALRGLDASADQVRIFPGDRVEIVGTRVGTLRIPIDDHGRMRINFRCSLEDFVPAYSYSNLYSVLEDEGFAKQIFGDLNGKFVFVGNVTTGGSDTVTTPLGRMPGVAVQATILANILESDHMRIPPPWLGVLGSVALAVIIGYLLSAMRSVWRQILLSFIVLGAIGGIVLWFTGQNWLLPAIAPMSAVLGTSIAVLGIQVLGERSENTRVRSLFRPYLASSLYEKLLSEDRFRSEKSVRSELSIFFSDIRGFTAWTERRDPEEVTEVLNEYFTAMLPIVERHGGTLDKLMGDGILVFFGAPVPMADHAARAVTMAWEMQQEIGRLQERWKLQDRLPLMVGMGIHTGYVTVGNFGSDYYKDYTVIGSAVNLAARIEGKAPGGKILITGRTLACARERIETRPHDDLSVKGVLEPVKVHEVTGLKNRD